MTGEELRGTLEALGWSRVQLADRLGVRERSVRYWARGDVPVPAEVAGWLRRMLLSHQEVERLHPAPRRHGGNHARVWKAQG